MRRLLLMLVSALVVFAVWHVVRPAMPAVALPSPQLSAAQRQYRAGKFAQAERLATAQLTADAAAGRPDSADLRVLRGQARVQQGKLVGAAVDLTVRNAGKSECLADAERRYTISCCRIRRCWP